jgi:hypothetical protein
MTGIQEVTCPTIYWQVMQGLLMSARNEADQKRIKPHHSLSKDKNKEMGPSGVHTFPILHTSMV